MPGGLPPGMPGGVPPVSSRGPPPQSPVGRLDTRHPPERKVIDYSGIKLFFLNLLIKFIIIR